MNEEAIGRLNTLLGLEDKLRQHPNLRKVRQMVMDEILAYENDPGQLGGEEKPEPPTPNPAAQFEPLPDRIGKSNIEAQPMNKIPNDPKDSAGGQQNRRT